MPRPSRAMHFGGEWTLVVAVWTTTAGASISISMLPFLSGTSATVCTSDDPTLASPSVPEVRAYSGHG